jgi:hypothetical protein
MPGKAKRAQIHKNKMDAKRKSKAAKQSSYLRSGPKRVTSSNKAKPKQAQPHQIPKGHEPSRKGILKAERIAKHSRAMDRAAQRHTRTDAEQLELLADRTGRRMDSPEFLNMKEVKRLMARMNKA